MRVTIVRLCVCVLCSVVMVVLFAMFNGFKIHSIIEFCHFHCYHPISVHTIFYFRFALQFASSRLAFQSFEFFVIVIYFVWYFPCIWTLWENSEIECEAKRKSWNWKWAWVVNGSGDAGAGGVGGQKEISPTKIRGKKVNRFEHNDAGLESIPKFEIYIKYMIRSKENADNNNGKNTTATALFYLTFEQRTNTA